MFYTLALKLKSCLAYWEGVKNECEYEWVREWEGIRREGWEWEGEIERVFDNFFWMSGCLNKAVYQHVNMSECKLFSLDNKMKKCSDFC